MLLWGKQRCVEAIFNFGCRRAVVTVGLLATQEGIPPELEVMYVGSLPVDVALEEQDVSFPSRTLLFACCVSHEQHAESALPAFCRPSPHS